MILTLMVLIIAIGSVCAGADGILLSDGDDFEDEDDLGLDGENEGDDSDSEGDDDLDDDGSDFDDDEDDDWDDDGSDFDDDEDDDWDDDGSDFDDDDFDDEDEDFDGEFDGEFELTAAGFAFSSAKGMNMDAGAYSSAGSQNSVNANPQTGNPIFILLLSLLLLIVIPLRK